MKKKKGISLIVLIITIIVVIILAVTIILTINKNNTLSSAKEAVFRQDIATMKEELEIYKANMKYNDKNPETLNADKKSDPSVQEIITSMPNKYANILKIEDGKLVYIGKNKDEYLIAKDMGLIPEGTLIDDDIFEELKPFITEWTVEDGDSITLPIAGKCNFKVDYGDGTGEYKVTSASDEDRIHTYENAGTYTVTITGKCEAIDFYSSDCKLKITKLIQWGTLGEGLSSNLYSFSGCTNLSGTIPEPSLNTFKNVKDCSGLFDRCSSLTGNIPENLFKGASKIREFGIYWGRGAFRDCKNLTGSIPAKLFSDCVNVINFDFCFYGCSSLTGSIPRGLLSSSDKIEKVMGTNMNGGMFQGCSGLTGEIPDDLFSTCTKVTNYTSVFSGCSSLTGKIPENLFSNSPNATNFSYTFNGCANLNGEIPANLFANCPQATVFDYTFCGCNNLSGEIPGNLFSNCPKVTSFKGTFQLCKSLNAISPKLFSNNSEVTTFGSTFLGCQKIDKIPSGLFDSCIKVKDFSGTFQEMNNLISIPEGLFDKNTLVTSFGASWYRGTFQSCSNLVSVPENLFKYNTEVTSFECTFLGCSKLTNMPDLSNNIKVSNVAYMFSSCSNLQGSCYPLWKNTGITSYGRCFEWCNKLSNYSEIPAGWK